MSGNDAVFTENAVPSEPGYDAVQTSETLLSFIAASPTPFHAAAGFSRMLDARGFTALSETEPWQLQCGGKYYVTRNDSSIIAFCVPETKPSRFLITAAHSDSPSFRLKKDPYLETAEHYTQLNIEKYGGAILSPWLDRPLSVAGRVVVRTDESLPGNPGNAGGAQQVHLQQRLVNLDRDLVLIPNLAIHMNRQVNEGYSYKVQTDMLPLFGSETAKGRLEELIAAQLDIKKEQIISSDLFLYNRTPGTIWGADNEFISAPRLDDLQCAYSCMYALTAGRNQDAVTVCAVFDNEEVGSLTKQGADSTFLEDTLRRAAAALGLTAEEWQIAIAGSFMVSADNAHALHPQHTDKADPVHRPLMNHGPVIKFSANQKYTSDAVSAAVFQTVCEMAGVPWQTFHNHSDQTGGSTLGNLSNAHLSLNTVDIGLPQLAMHSPYETAGVKDTAYLIEALKVYYRSSILQENGQFVITG